MVRQFRVLMDADVLVDAQVRDLFLRMAEADLIDVCWSRQIPDETRQALTTKLHLTTAASDKLLGALQAAFPTAVVHGFDHLVGKLALPDPDDRHVLAAAIHGECDLLVTNNVKDFPEEAVAAIRGADIAIVSVDDALREFVVIFGDRLASVVAAQVAALRNPPMTLDEFIARLCVRAPTGGPALGAALGLQRFAAIFAGIESAEGADGPHEAVRLLVEALLDDAKSTMLLIDDDLARRMTSRPSPSRPRPMKHAGGYLVMCSPPKDGDSQPLRAIPAGWRGADAQSQADAAGDLYSLVAVARVTAAAGCCRCI
jgi:predicted nucleic acid-binding protein